MRTAMSETLRTSTFSSVLASAMSTECVYRAMASLSVPLDGVEPSDFLVDHDQFKLELDGTTIDILSSIGEMPFDQAWLIGFKERSTVSRSRSSHGKS